MSKSLIRSAKVKSVVAAAILAAGTLGATSAIAQTVSKESAKTLKAAQDAAAAKRYPEVIAKAQETLANPKKTKDDAYVAYSMLAHAYYATGNNAELLNALQGQIDSGWAGADVGKIKQTQVGVAFQSKSYDKAIGYGTDLIRSGAANPEVYTTVGQSYFAQNKYGEAARFFNSLVSETEKRGRQPREQDIKLLLASYDKAGNKDGAQAALEKLVKFYPTPSTWNALIYDLNAQKKSPAQEVHVFRLMDATGNLKQGRDFLRYYEVTGVAGLPAEGYSALDAGIKANAFSEATDKSRAERYLASAKTRADAAKAEIPKNEAQGKAAADGKLDVVVGMQKFSVGDYTGAIEALNRGLSKGGLTSAVDAQLTLGVAQLKANQKGDAIKTFNSIKTEDPITQRIIKLWTLNAS